MLILSAQIWSQIAYSADWSEKHWVGITLFSTWTVIAVIYRAYIWYFADEKVSSTHCHDGNTQANKRTLTNGDTNAIITNGHINYSIIREKKKV